jgi:hypothetical protein
VRVNNCAALNLRANPSSCAVNYNKLSSKVFIRFAAKNLAQLRLQHYEISGIVSQLNRNNPAVMCWRVVNDVREIAIKGKKHES